VADNTTAAAKWKQRNTRELHDSSTEPPVTYIATFSVTSVPKMIALAERQIKSEVCKAVQMGATLGTLMYQVWPQNTTLGNAYIL